MKESQATKREIIFAKNIVYKIFFGCKVCQFNLLSLFFCIIHL